jgi:hypothetical protein
VHDQHVRVREQVQLHQLLMNPVPAPAQSWRVQPRPAYASVA